jgi:prepilin-type N-terminal cleavage/methylation domain-containing protein
MNPMRTRPGLTLLELVVVLVILAILTTVAIEGTSGVIDQGRYDATQRTLQNVQNAIIGPTGQHEPDGTPLVTGFVADIGRLPLATADATGALTLDELWSNPNGVAAFSFQPAAAPDTDVLVPCGWRGPYLQLPLGTTQLRDGWGNPLSLLQADGVTTITTAGTPIPWIRSLGSDDATGGTGYAADTDVIVVGPGINRYQSALTVNVTFVTQAGIQTTAPSGGTVSGLTVTHFGPNPANGLALSLPNTTPTSGTTTFSFPRPGSTDVITIGPRAVRASCSYSYVPSGSAAGTSPTTVTLKSPLTWLVLQAGGQAKNVYINLPN